MALFVYGASRSAVRMPTNSGDLHSSLGFIRIHESDPQPTTTIGDHRTLTIAIDGEHEMMGGTSVAITGWVWPGYLLSKSRALRSEFRSAATTALLSPSISVPVHDQSERFASMFEPQSLLPSTAAFAHVTANWQKEIDQDPTKDSLVIAVYRIDNFSSVEGGKFERSMTQQLARRINGFPSFGGRPFFLGAGRHGEFWIAYRCGPIVRSGIDTLRSLQQHINEEGLSPTYADIQDRKSTRLNSSHSQQSRMPSSA